MSEERYDLHCHSVYSDGTKTIEELFDLAVEVGLKGLSITDHDTIKGYKEALSLVTDYPLKLLPGVEVSSEHSGSSVHILVYGFSPHDPKMNAFINKQQHIREERNVKIIEKLKAHGMPLNLDQLKEDIGVVGRPHIAQALADKGHVANAREAFDRFIAEGQPCFEPGNRPSAEQVIALAKEVRGFAIIAHPHLIRDNTLVKELLALPFDGLEARYALFNPREEKKWIRFADSRGWIKTGGSDYHGEFKPHIPLGASWVRDQTFNLLYDRYLENDHLHRAQ